MFTTQFQEWIRNQARRLVRATGLDRVSPNALTLLGLLVNVCSGVLIGVGALLAGGIVLLLASVFDILDGAVARVTGKVYRYGAFLDSTTDRYAEGCTFIGLMAHYLSTGPHTVEPVLVMASLMGSLLVSYVRARAQSLGFACEGGLLARPERVVLICIGLLVTQTLLPVLWILAVLTNVTAVQRIWFVWRQSQTGAVAPAQPAVPASAAAQATGDAGSPVPDSKGAQTGEAGRAAPGAPAKEPERRPMARDGAS